MVDGEGGSISSSAESHLYLNSFIFLAAATFAVSTLKCYFLKESYSCGVCNAKCLFSKLDQIFYLLTLSRCLMSYLMQVFGFTKHDQVAFYM